MHEGLIPVVEELNRRGWRTKHWTSRTGRHHPGQPFSKQALLSILKNVTYMGQVSYKGTIHPGEQPPIVDERLWQEVNRRLERGSRVAAIGITYVRTRNGAAGMRVRVVPFRRS
jgi:site-specific DNA recombinase